MSYTGVVTAVLDDRATLACMDEQTRKALSAAADNYENGSLRLQKAIYRAAMVNGDKPADIARAIGHVYTYDYVAKLVREWRSGKRPAPAQS